MRVIRRHTHLLGSCAGGGRLFDRPCRHSIQLCDAIVLTHAFSVPVPAYDLNLLT